jgi:HSP20 family protein
MMATWSGVPTLDRVFDEAVRSASRSRGPVATFAAAVDVREKADEYVFQVDVPGVKVADLEVTLENRVLAIRGARHREAGESETVTAGRSHGQFALSYALPDCIDGEHLTADLADGVLTIRVPKHPKAMPRKIAISGAAGGNQRTE